MPSPSWVVCARAARLFLSRLCAQSPQGQPRAPAAPPTPPSIFSPSLSFSRLDSSPPLPLPIHPPLPPPALLGQLFDQMARFLTLPPSPLCPLSLAPKPSTAVVGRGGARDCLLTGLCACVLCVCVCACARPRLRARRGTRDLSPEGAARTPSATTTIPTISIHLTPAALSHAVQARPRRRRRRWASVCAAPPSPASPPSPSRERRMRAPVCVGGGVVEERLSRPLVTAPFSFLPRQTLPTVSLLSLSLPPAARTPDPCGAVGALPTVAPPPLPSPLCPLSRQKDGKAPLAPQTLCAAVRHTHTHTTTVILSSL